jgi:hypothetical protein
MAYTVQSAFEQAVTNLTLTTLQESTVSTRQSGVRQAMENGLTVQESFLTGSYRRHTLIPPLKDADVDIFVVLDPSYYHNYNGQNGGQAGLLDRVKRTLLRTYTQTPDISRNGQAITIRFSDFSVDVVPAFKRQGGGYLIANGITQSWISTDPKQHVELVSAMNTRQQGLFVPLIRLLKSWNRSHSSYFRSFHLEVLMLQIMQAVTITDYPSGMRYFFDKARDLVRVQNPDPAGYGGDVGSYINGSKVEEAVLRLQRAYEGALRAEDHARRNATRDALNSWRQLVGENFPSYG